MAARNNDIHYINKKLTEAFDLLGGNTKEYRLYVKDVLGLELSQFDTNVSKHIKAGQVGKLKLLRNNKVNNKKAKILRDIANTARASRKEYKEKLEDLQASAMAATMLQDMINDLYQFLNENHDCPEEMDEDLYYDIKDLFYRSGKPSKEKIEEVYARFQKYMQGETPEGMTTDVVDETAIPDED